MAVQPQTPYKEYTANGSANSFALEFDCDNQDHLIVLVDDIEPVVGAWSLIGGAVVFGTTPASGKKIIIQRNTPFRRDGDFQSYDNSFRPGPVNKGFDWVWLKLQELGVADWILSNRIDALKKYVDDRDDELRAYLLEEIHKQGVALDQLEDYYNYLMQRLAQIAVDKGWDASFVVDGNENQHQINRTTIRTVNSIADMVAINNPKHGQVVDVASYYVDENKGGGKFHFDSLRISENDGVSVFNGWVRDLSDRYISTDDAGLKEDGSNATVRLQALADAIGNNFKVEIIGKHLVNKRIRFLGKPNTNITGDGEISAKELRDTFIFENHYGILFFQDCPYTTISKGVKVTGAKKFWLSHSDPTQAGDSPISLKYCPHSLIEHTVLSHSVAWGIVAENSPYTIAQFNKIDDIVRQSGINLVINGGQYCKTIGNTITNVGLYGIEWETYSHSVGNYSSGNVISDCSTGTAITGTSALEIDIVDDQINFCNVGVNTYPLLNARRVSINARGLGCFLALSSASVKNVTYENCNFDYSINKAWLQRSSSNFVLKYGATRAEIYTFPDSTITSGITIYIKDVAYSVTAVTTVSDSEFSPSITALKKITLASTVASDVGFYPAIKTAVTQAGSKALESALTNIMLKYKNNTFTGYGIGISNATNYPDEGVGREYYLKNTFINCDKWLSMPTSVAKGAYISGTDVIGINSITVNSTVTLTQLKTAPIRVINPSPRSAGVLTIPFKLDNAATRYKIVVSFVSGVTTGTVVIKIDGVDSYTISQATWSASSTKVFEVYGIGNVAAGGHTLSIVDTVGDLTFTSYTVDVYVS